ncbi:MAG: hypothetical protein KDI19_11465, partial [Pseudomonadales bacterium]|nr:hypothetical protein [Pseudomonadales bacterium]
FSTTTALFDAPPESVMIRNQDNLLLTLNHDPASDSVSGSITAGEDVLATIEESDTGLLVRFNDGQDPNVQTLTF